MQVKYDRANTLRGRLVKLAAMSKRHKIKNGQIQVGNHIYTWHYIPESEQIQLQSGSLQRLFTVPASTEFWKCKNYADFLRPRLIQWLNRNPDEDHYRIEPID